MVTTYNHIADNKRKSALLIALFAVLVLAVGYAIGLWYGNDYAYTGITLAALFVVPYSFIGYFTSDKIALAVNRAHPVNKEQTMDLHRMVENIAITAGVPKPAIYIIEDAAPNAFATGRDPKHASIAFTTGILHKLNKTELEGVIAHEMSHVKNYDIRLMTLVIVFVGVITLLAYFFTRFGMFGGRRRSGSSDNGQLGGILAIAGLLLLILSPLFAKLIQLAVSRKREFLADAEAALLTRYPEGLASALEKISADTTVARTQNQATAHLFISEPRLKAEAANQEKARLFTTHPAITARVKRLREMANLPEYRA